MKNRFLIALLLAALLAALQPPAPALSQMGGGYTCGVIEMKQMSSARTTPVFRPYKGSETDWWFVDDYNGIQVYSTGENLDPYNLVGQPMRIWMPDFDLTTGRMTSIANYEFVSSCEPVVEFWVDENSLRPGECTTLYWYVDNVSNLNGIYLDGEIVDPSGSVWVCPIDDAAFFLQVTAGWGEVSARVDVRMQAPTQVPPTKVPPSPIPTARVISTLVVPAQAQEIGVPELSVAGINQHLDPPVTLAIGAQDNGLFDCYIASTAMILDYYQSQGRLDASANPGYRALVPAVRGSTPPGAMLSNDPAFVTTVTGGRVSAQAVWVDPANLISALEIELRAGDPVLAGTPNGGRLAAGWQNMGGHSIVVYGVHDGRVYYMDPWDGGAYSLTLDAFIRADTYPEGSSFLVVFEPER